MGQARRRKLAGNNSAEPRGVIPLSLDHIWPGSEGGIERRAATGDNRAARCMTALYAAVHSSTECTECGAILHRVDDLGVVSVLHLGPDTVGVAFCRACATSQEAVSVLAKKAAARLVSGEASSNTVCRQDDPHLYWVASRGAALPHYPIPYPASVMRRSIVHVGRNSSEQTIWLIASARTGDTAAEVFGLKSNYDLLIGYRTAQEQEAAVSRFLTGTDADIRMELRRAQREAVIIRGNG